MKLAKFRLGDETFLVTQLQAVPIQQLLSSKDENDVKRGKKLLRKSAVTDLNEQSMLVAQGDEVEVEVEDETKTEVKVEAPSKPEAPVSPGAARQGLMSTLGL